MKFIAISPPRKDTILNQDINMLGAVKDQSLPPQLSKFCPRYKSLRIEAYDDRNDSTDTSRTYKEDYVENLKYMNNKNSDDEYKEGKSQHQHINESFIDKTKE